MARKRTIVTVQPEVVRNSEGEYVRSLLRLRGKWLGALFPPYTQLLVTREERAGKTVLVLEEVPESFYTGGEAPS